MQVFFIQSQDSNKTAEWTCPKKGQTCSPFPSLFVSLFEMSMLKKRHMHQCVKPILMDILAGITNICLRSFWGAKRQKKNGNENWVASRSTRVNVPMRSLIFFNWFIPEASMKMCWPPVAHQGCSLPDDRQEKCWWATLSHKTWEQPSGAAPAEAFGTTWQFSWQALWDHLKQLFCFPGGTKMPNHPTLPTNLQGLALTIPSYSNPDDSQVGRWDDLATTHPPALRSNLTCCEQYLPRWSSFEGDWSFHALRLHSLSSNSQLTVAWLLLYDITVLGNTCTVRHTFCSVKSCAANHGAGFWGQCGADTVL